MQSGLIRGESNVFITTLEHFVASPTSLHSGSLISLTSLPHSHFPLKLLQMCSGCKPEVLPLESEVCTLFSFFFLSCIFCSSLLHHTAPALLILALPKPCSLHLGMPAPLLLHLAKPNPPPYCSFLHQQAGQERSEGGKGENKLRSGQCSCVTLRVECNKMQ